MAYFSTWSLLLEVVSKGRERVKASYQFLLACKETMYICNNLLCASLVGIFIG